MIKSTIKITKTNITILIITLLILFQSTNVGSEENYFQIKNFEIQEKIEINFSREKIIEESLKKTFNQLKKWKIKYHRLIFGKPSFDLFIDDRALFFKKNWPKVLDRYL